VKEKSSALTIVADFITLRKQITMKNSVEEILMLPLDERLKAVETILESITNDSDDEGLTSAQMDELQARRKAYEEGKMKFYSWEEVKANIRRKKQ